MTLTLCTTRPVSTAAQATSPHRGLKWSTRTEIINGLLVSFSPMGRGTLGNTNGRSFKTYFRVTFRKTGTKPGRPRCPSEPFNIPLVRSMVSLSFITAIWLFTRNRKRGAVIRLMFEWPTWAT